jgi:hypothetical protein
MVTCTAEQTDSTLQVNSVSVKYNGSGEHTTVPSLNEECVRISSESGTEESAGTSEHSQAINRPTDAEKKPYISAEALYPSGSFESTALYTWVAARKKLAEGIIFLDAALGSFDDEIEREIQLSHLYGILRELSSIQDFNMDFESIISVMRASLYHIITHEVSISAAYLVKLREHVFKALRENINLHEKVFSSIIGAITKYELDLISLGLSE